MAKRGNKIKLILIVLSIFILLFIILFLIFRQNTNPVASLSGNAVKQTLLIKPVYNQSNQKDYVDGEIIVQFKDNVDNNINNKIRAKANPYKNKIVSSTGVKTDISSVDALLKKYNSTEISNTVEQSSDAGRDNLTNVKKIKISGDVNTAVKDFSKDSNVAYAEPNYLFYLFYSPSDTDGIYAAYASWYNRLMQSEQAWDINKGSSSIVIAVIDTGVYFDHPDLNASKWTNKNEIVNGIDDDQNGYVDDTIGWDFYSNDNNPYPDLGITSSSGTVAFHGTFVAGMIGARDDGVGTIGICPKCSIMALKVFTSDGGAPSQAIADAIHYAADNGADIISMSFGSSHKDNLIGAAVKYANSKGVLLVAAAGNGGNSVPSYPAAYDEVISVGATNNMDSRATFSSYGNKVDISAPGEDVVSTAVISKIDESRGYGKVGSPAYFQGSGTSFSAPLVSGLAGLLLSQNPNLGMNQLRQIILDNSDKFGRDIPKTDKPIGIGRINAFKALNYTKYATFNLKITNGGNGKVISSDKKIDCGTVCSANFSIATKPYLLATPNRGYLFNRWSGDCTPGFTNDGTPVCFLSFDSNKKVTVSFKKD